MYFYRLKLLIIVLGLFILTTYTSVALVVANKAELSEDKNSDVLLVPGARVNINGKLNPCLESRIHQAIKLYNEGKVKKILFSGGSDSEDNVNEAEAMKDISIALGVRQEDILVEKNASSTYENFSFSKEILRNNGLNSVLIVTEPFHQARATMVAHKLGLSFGFSPVKNSPCWVPNRYLSRYFLKEPIAILVYKLQNKI